MPPTDRIIRVLQGTPEWWEAKRGKPSAGSFSRIVTPTGKLSKQSVEYAYDLLSQRLLPGSPMEIEAYTSRAMQLGVDSEPAARLAYSLETGHKVEQVGCVLSECGRYLCSPDGLIGDDGGLELKCPMLKTHVGYMLTGILPVEYVLQVHGALAVTGRKWWDFVSYAERMPLFVVRVEPDDFTVAVGEAVRGFCDDLDKLWDRLQSMMPVVEDEPMTHEDDPFCTLPTPEELADPFSSTSPV